MVIPPINKRPFSLLSPLSIAAIYAVIGGLWIVFSDRALSSMINDPPLLTRLQTYKGWGFVAITAVLLYWMINRYNAKMKHSEAALIESEERFRTLAENAKDMIYRMSLPDGRYEYASPASLAIFGFSPEEFYDSPVLIQKRIHPDWQGYFREQWDNLLSGKMPPFYEYQIIHKSGEVKWLHQRNTLITDNEGRPIAIEGVVTDITQRKQAELELEKHRGHLEEMVKERTAELQDGRRTLMGLVEDLANKKKELEAANMRLKEIDRLKSQFIASMSHELRTPLNSVIGFSSILLNEWAGPLSDEQKDNLATVLRSGKHLLALINDVIDVSKIEAGTIDVHAEDFDLHDVVAEAAKLLEKDAKDKGIEFTVQNLHQPMHTDRRRLLQSVMNLVSNAVKFTERGSVRVQTRLSAECGVRNAELKEAKHPERSLPPNALIGGTDSELNNNFDYIEIIVEDTGIGINKDDLPKLFHSFVRLDSPLRATVLGTGLGLYLTKKLVTEVLKGEITVASEEHEGSRFAIIVPIGA
ncbi:MAG TPA: histidine kinase dimerization/phospho-acceptor domain-containing protein [Nitrospirota bacterium]|nr:histidine kinase dimerization/phospho-acceptor domain-containing protein [Nitrospirota bacterium]